MSRRGRLVAVVLSSEEYDLLRSARTQFGDAYKAFLERHAVAEVGLDAEHFESLRDKDPGRRVRL